MRRNLVKGPSNRPFNTLLVVNVMTGGEKREEEHRKRVWIASRKSIDASSFPSSSLFIFSVSQTHTLTDVKACQLAVSAAFLLSDCRLFTHQSSSPFSQQPRMSRYCTSFLLSILLVVKWSYKHIRPLSLSFWRLVVYDSRVIEYDDVVLPTSNALYDIDAEHIERLIETKAQIVVHRPVEEISLNSFGKRKKHIKTTQTDRQTDGHQQLPLIAHRWEK